MDTPVAIYLYADDPVSMAGLGTQLRAQPEVQLVDRQAIDADTVGVVAADVVDESTMSVLRDLNKEGCRRVVLVVTTLDDGMLFPLIDAGVCAVVRRVDATPARLAQLAARAAADEGALPADIQGRLLKQVSRLQHNVLAPRGLSSSGLSIREISVLRLVADGLDTHQIARELCYSERTVKVVLHDIISRFQLRNRSHAVAYALREGMI